MKIGRRHINTQQELANCIRFLAVDAIDKANSGHPGMPLGLADVMTVLFQEKLRHDPKNPQWQNRDRVILSNGHGSMLLYSALYLSGYDWTIEDLKQFRQMKSIAAGHPEYELEKGIEVTTGPLGQGLANAVGVAIAKERLQHLYGEDKINYHTYCFVGDGCLMEGISHEACALAPKVITSGLTIIWDDNGISIDGKIDPWFEHDVLQRFSSYGFEVIEGVDGHDPEAIRQALDKARSAKKPCFIQMKTVIGKGCSMIEGSEKAHGQPLSQDQISLMREELNWPHKPFEIPEQLKEMWNMRSNTYDTSWVLPQQEDISQYLLAWLDKQEDKSLATRKQSSLVLQAISSRVTHLMGGSADLAVSNLTHLAEKGSINDHQFQYAAIDYGVREFGMFAIANGLALSGMMPFVATFMTFMDYGRNALRMAALMKLRVIYILTHDSIGLGEDGPTHQPVEHLTMCRATPGVMLWRPCNLQETVAAWLFALQYDGPTVLALSRQSIGVIPRQKMSEVSQGAYLQVSVEKPQATVFATGSEAEIALGVAEQLAKQGIHINVVSVPCFDLLAGHIDVDNLVKNDRDQCYVIEAAASISWGEFAPKQNIFAVDNFGYSAPSDDLYTHFGLTVSHISSRIIELMNKI